MHILIAALHRPSKPTGVCRHAANLAQCLALRDTVIKVTLVIGKWQKDYFEKSFTLSSPKIEVIIIDIKNNSVSRNLWFLFGLPKLAGKLKCNLVHLSFPYLYGDRYLTVQHSPLSTTSIPMNFQKILVIPMLSLINYSSNNVLITAMVLFASPRIP
jgi:hypothetical protein